MHRLRIAFRERAVNNEINILIKFIVWLINCWLFISIYNLLVLMTLSKSSRFNPIQDEGGQKGFSPVTSTNVGLNFLTFSFNLFATLV